MLELFNLPRDGLLSLETALATMIHPDDRGRYAGAVGAALRPDGPRELREEIRVAKPHGYRWVAITARAFLRGRPAGCHPAGGSRRRRDRPVRHRGAARLPAGTHRRAAYRDRPGGDPGPGGARARPVPGGQPGHVPHRGTHPGQRLLRHRARLPHRRGTQRCRPVPGRRLRRDAVRRVACRAPHRRGRRGHRSSAERRRAQQVPGRQRPRLRRGTPGQGRRAPGTAARPAGDATRLDRRRADAAGRGGRADLGGGRAGPGQSRSCATANCASAKWSR